MIETRWVTISWLENKHWITKIYDKIACYSTVKNSWQSKEKKADDHSELGLVKITQVKASHPFAEFNVVRIQVGQFIHLCERERAWKSRRKNSLIGKKCCYSFMMRKCYIVCLIFKFHHNESHFISSKINFSLSLIYSQRAEKSSLNNERKKVYVKSSFNNNNF